MTAFAPLPEFARGPDILEGGFVVTDLGGGVHGITQGMINTMFLVTGKGVVLVDAPPVLGDHLLSAIEEVTPKPVTHLIYSHAHADHIGAAHLLDRSGLKIIAHELTARFIKEAQDDRRPLPNETFGGTRKELSVDGVRFVLDYTGDWHQAGNLFIHLPEQKAMAAMDSFTVKNAPFFRLLLSAHVPAYFQAMDELLEYDFETIVTGHMSLYGTPEDVQTNREYLRDLRAAATEALRTVDLKQTAAAAVPESNRQAELKVWMDAVVAHAAELMPPWDKRLGGTDIFLADNLNAVAWSVFID
ncbi:MBL fold metallo-hydrolase [Streptomyces olivochromogenes]|uniref:MBL fold metallo-hydrolase n=1 Tax=Streptomyces olivochromogenes TaxID=1963 RepID=UPI001F30ED38|nr:MBL fold metallo-hydrolase [Streptomyces olivochromogenes]MCF3128947.1 MBL fold metallo-hydrolase [Streptomyces olivochromogenes]